MAATCGGLSYAAELRPKLRPDERFVERTLKAVVEISGLAFSETCPSGAMPRDLPVRRGQVLKGEGRSRGRARPRGLDSAGQPVSTR